MKIAILGTRGIPNNYGGFEQFAEFLSVGLVKLGHDVTVYNGHQHPYKQDSFSGVSIKHIFDPEDKLGTVSQFIYDFLSIIDSRKSDFDIILQLGYTSSSVFFPLHSKKSILVTNMDGLEWKRSKYTHKVQKFLKYAESLAVKYSDKLISDSIGIQNYLQTKYNVDSTFIPYGSYVIENFSEDTLKKYNLEKYRYNMLIARLEPENNIETILDGIDMTQNTYKMLVIGNNTTKYGTYLIDKFRKNTNIVFLNGIYNQDILNDLRNYSNIYFHGHTVGGTNPSLLEAMGSHAFICAHKNEFNKAVLGDDAIYFENSNDIANALKYHKKEHLNFIENNIVKIKTVYEWDFIIRQYEKEFLNILNSKNRS